MSSLSVTNTFANGQDNDADEVNTNFSDVVSYVNTNCVTKDGALDFDTKPASLAHGIVAYTAVTSSQGSISSLRDVTSATVTWTAVTGHDYEIIVSALFTNTGSVGGTTLRVTDSSSTTKFDWVAPNFAFATGINYTYVERGLTGSITRKLRTSAGSGTTTLNGSSTTPTLIYVKDLGKP